MLCRNSLILIALTSAFGAFTDNVLNLTILHTNDVHSHFDTFNRFGTFCDQETRNTSECFGGSARLKTLINQWRQKRSNVLLLDAGDEFQGTQFYTYYKGNVTKDIMNELKYDLMTIGNHEFDDGPEHLASFFSLLNFPVVCSNVELMSNPKLKKWVKPYHLFPQYKLAVIGFTTPTTKTISSPGPTVQFMDPIQVMQKYIDEVRALGYKRVIGLSHFGYKEDQDLAKQLKGLSLIVGGHSHSYLSVNPYEKGAVGPYPTIVQDKDNRGVYIVQAASFSKYLGQIDMTIDSQGQILSFQGRPIPVDTSIKEDPEMAQKISGWRKLFDEIGKRVIGEATDAFDQEGCYSQECLMGTLVTDSILHTFLLNSKSLKPGLTNSGNADFDFTINNHLTHLSTVPSIVSKFNNQVESNSNGKLVFMNSGGIRAGLNKGLIRVRDLEIVFPFENKLVAFEANGSTILQILEGVLAHQNYISGTPVTSFAQVAGFQFQYDPSLREYCRVLSLDIIDQNDDGTTQYTPIRAELNYTVITIDYLADGGDGFFSAPQISRRIDLNLPLDEVIAKYISDYTPISPHLDGRIVAVQSKQPFGRQKFLG